MLGEWYLPPGECQVILPIKKVPFPFPTTLFSPLKRGFPKPHLCKQITCTPLNLPGPQIRRSETAARFVGEPYPVAGGPLTRCAWWLRLFAWHLPIRLFVLPGDLPVHDYHHHRPLGAWIDALYARQALAAPGGARLSETWGMYEPINRVLSSIAQLPAAPTYNRERTVVPIEM